MTKKSETLPSSWDTPTPKFSSAPTALLPHATDLTQVRFHDFLPKNN
jgi:hypothetical protein